MLSLALVASGAGILYVSTANACGRSVSLDADDDDDEHAGGTGGARRGCCGSRSTRGDDDGVSLRDYNAWDGSDDLDGVSNEGTGLSAVERVRARCGASVALERAQRQFLRAFVNDVDTDVICV